MTGSYNTSRAGRLTEQGKDGELCDDGEPHRWQPLSFVFETQLLDDEGRVRIRQPDTREGRVYVVCMECCCHTYVVTEWVGYYLGGPPSLGDEREDADNDRT